MKCTQECRQGRDCTCGSIKYKELSTQQWTLLVGLFIIVIGTIIIFTK